MDGMLFLAEYYGEDDGVSGGTYVIAWLICGAICSAIAASKGRTPIGWFFAGLLGLIGIVIISVQSNLTEERRRRQEQQGERRRLQEQLRQEKMKNEAFRQHSAGRLDAHDRVLGVSTRTGPELIGGRGAPLMGQGGPPGTPPPNAPWQPATEEWYYESEGTSHGPVSRAAMQRLLVQGAVTPTTLVWAQHLKEWTPLARVAGLRPSARP